MKVVSLLSGGIDSTTLVYYLVSELGFDVTALTINYGQKHMRECHAAHSIAEKLGIPHISLDLNDLGKYLQSALTTNEVNVPEVSETVEHYETLQMTVVPNRNMIMLAIAAGIAKSIGGKAVAYAAHWSDRGVYPDCRIEFARALEKTLRLALDDPDFRVYIPFGTMDKGEIVRLGHRIGVPYELTWSCYKGGDFHCGVCSSCRERKRAFQEAGIPDPTEYTY